MFCVWGSETSICYYSWDWDGLKTDFSHGGILCQSLLGCDWLQPKPYLLMNIWIRDIQSFSSTVLLFSRENFSSMLFCSHCSARYSMVGLWYGWNATKLRSTSLATGDLKTLKLFEVSPAGMLVAWIWTREETQEPKHNVLSFQKKYSEINHQNIIWKWWNMIKSWKWSSSQGLCFNWEAMFSWFKKHFVNGGCRQAVSPLEDILEGTGGSIDQCVAAGWS